MGSGGKQLTEVKSVLEQLWRKPRLLGAHFELVKYFPPCVHASILMFTALKEALQCLLFDLSTVIYRAYFKSLGTSEQD